MKALVFPRRKSDRIVKLLEFEQVIDREINSIAGTSELSDEKLNMFFKMQALRYGKSNAQEWLAINALLVTFRGPYARLSDSGAQWLEEIALWDRTELAVTGAEIADALGREAGPWTAQMLDRLLAEAALQGTENDKSRLILLAQQYGKELEMP
jgi:tRNA nucleotidyltransferase/poly(A) polymerase